MTPISSKGGFNGFKSSLPSEAHMGFCYHFEPSSDIVAWIIPLVVTCLIMRTKHWGWRDCNPHNMEDAIVHSIRVFLGEIWLLHVQCSSIPWISAGWGVQPLQSQKWLSYLCIWRTVLLTAGRETQWCKDKCTHAHNRILYASHDLFPRTDIRVKAPQRLFKAKIEPSSVKFWECFYTLLLAEKVPPPTHTEFITAILSIQKQPPLKASCLRWPLSKPPV